MRRATVACSLLLLVSCASEPQRDDSGGWVGTITTEGNVTTVVNESSSVWGGRATLVEELSIGVDAGDPEYMLGRILHVWDTGDRIFAVDRSVPAIRVFGGDGIYVGDVGRDGQGPGEYRVPWSVAVLPDGRILITDTQAAGWIDVFNPDLSHATRWGPFPDQLTVPGARLLYDLTLDRDGRAHLRYWELDVEANSARFGWRAVDAEGVGPVRWPPEPDFEQKRNCLAADCSLSLTIPFRQQPLFTLTPSGRIVGGVGDTYAFEMHEPDGAITHVVHHGEPVSLEDDEWDYWTRRVRAQGLARNASWQESWSDGVPRTKPAFYRFYPARDGRLLVVREGPSRRIASCTEDPLQQVQEFIACWEPTYIWDFFDTGGKYLGAIEPPTGRPGRPFIDGDRITVPIEDDAGVQRIKRYRLVLPGEE